MLPMPSGCAGKIYELEDFKEAIAASTEIGHGGKVLLEG